MIGVRSVSLRNKHAANSDGEKVAQASISVNAQQYAVAWISVPWAVAMFFS